MIVVCVVGPLARWSTGPRQPVSPSARQPLAGFCPVWALIWPVFGENPANADWGGVGRGQNEGAGVGILLGLATIADIGLGGLVGSWPVVLRGPLTL